MLKSSGKDINVNFKGKKILVADDNSSLRSILNDFLKDCGCSVFLASNGKEALELTKINEFDVLLTDIKMPFMNGIDFLREVPENNKKAIRIMMSGDASIEDVVSGFKQEIDDFIVKPFTNMDIIYKTIERQFIKTRLQEELNFKNTVHKNYNEILQQLISNSDPEKLFSYIFQTLKNIIPVNRMELLLFDTERKILTIKYILSDRGLISKPGYSTSTAKSAFAGFASEKSENIYLNSLQDLITGCSCPFIHNALKEGMNSAIIFPTKVEQNIFGFINFYSDKTNIFSEQHEYILKGIVPKISVSFERAIYQGRLSEENTFLRSNLKNLSNQLIFQQEALIFSLAELAEKRDKGTGYHLLRIQNFTRLLAESYFKNKEYSDIGLGKMHSARIIDLINKSSPLHDIGKVGIPDSILLKPEKLTKKEFEIIKTHTLIGAECLDNAAKRVNYSDFLYVSRDIANYHHERWDGEGYPKGIKGENIPISARIVTIADTYDALRSERVYKKAWKHSKVCSYIKKQKGKQFDPHLVDLFLELQDEIDMIYQKYKNESLEKK